MSNPSVSFEFYPPQTEAGQQQLLETAVELDGFEPEFMSITYGAAGSNRSKTVKTVEQLQDRGIQAPLMPHLTCVAHTKAEIRDTLLGYEEIGVNHLLALAGDRPQDSTEYSSDYSHASELIVAAKSLGNFRIGVAAHPEGHPDSPNPTLDRWYFAHKLGMADFAVTQFFFTADHYDRLTDDMDKLGVDKPIIPGILPVTNVDRLQHMANMNGTSIPSELADRLDKARNDSTEVEKIGIEVATELAGELIHIGAPGVHLYTMNRADIVSNVLRDIS